MRAAALALLLVAMPVGAQTTFSKWQDMGQYVGQQTVKLNEHTAQIAALRAEVDVLKSDMSLVIGRYDALLRAIVINVCASNKVMADNQWATTLIGLKPIPLTGHTCPTDPATTKYYVPSYLSPSGPPIPPP